MKIVFNKYSVLFLIILFLFQSHTGRGEVPGTGTTKAEKNYREDNIENFSKYLIIRPFLRIYSLNLEIMYVDPDNEDKDESTPIRYVPNTPLHYGAGVSYMGFGLSSQLAMSHPARDTDTYGESDFFDFQFYYFSRKFGIDFFFQNYSGYYLRDPGDFNLSMGDTGTVRSDIENGTAGLNIYYIFSDDYFFSSAFDQSERQKRSGGSLFLMASSLYYTIDSTGSLIPPVEEINYKSDSGFCKGKYFTTGIAVGYAYTLTVLNYYLTPVIYCVSGYMNSRYSVSSGEKVKHNSYIKLGFRLAMGYNGKTWFGGFALVNDGTFSETFEGSGSAGISVGVEIIYLELFIGRRFSI